MNTINDIILGLVNPITWKDGETLLNATNLNSLTNSIDTLSSNDEKLKKGIKNLSASVNEAIGPLAGIPVAAGKDTKGNKVSGSILFNDISSNNAYRRDSAVFGSSNTAGTYGYLITNFEQDTTANRYKITCSADVTGYTADQILQFSVSNYDHYANRLKIVSIEGNTITVVDLYPDEMRAIKLPTGGEDKNNFEAAVAEQSAFVYVLGVNAGTRINYLRGIFVAGNSNIGTGFRSTLFGWDNMGIGNYSFAAGRSNIVGYSGTAFGYGNNVLGDTGFAIGNINKIFGKNSFASGYKNVVSGDSAAAFGDENTVSGPGSLAIGASNTILAGKSLALGLSNTIGATANNSFILGSGNDITRESSLALGSTNNISAPNSLAMGTEAIVSGSGDSFAGGFVFLGNHPTASGRGSFAFGRGPVAEGQASVALGAQTLARGSFSFAAGISSKAYWEKSFAIGDSVETAAIGQIVLGRYNTQLAETVAVGNTGNVVAKYVEVVGVGISSTSRKNGRTLDASGNGWFAGELKVGGAGPEATDAKVVATQEYVNNKIRVGTTLPSTSNANEGDIFILVSDN